MCTVCVRCLVTCMPQWARKGKYGREVSSSAPKCSKVSPSGIENKDRSHRSLKPVLLLFFKILLNLRKPSKPSFRPPFQTLDPIFAQQVAILPTRPDRSSVRSGSQRNMFVLVFRLLATLDLLHVKQYEKLDPCTLKSGTQHVKHVSSAFIPKQKKLSTLPSIACSHSQVTGRPWALTCEPWTQHDRGENVLRTSAGWVSTSPQDVQIPTPHMRDGCETQYLKEQRSCTEVVCKLRPPDRCHGGIAEF